MRITFCGATREVTGSCYLVETPRTRVLVDCGMFQGSSFAEAKNFQPFLFDPKTIDAVCVTHAHLDHTGRLPKLVREGFKGKIFATPPTRQLTELVLNDAFHIMRDEERREARPLLYSEEDVHDALERIIDTDYEHSIPIGDLSVRYRDAGHIFGSAFIEFADANGRRATFSGDLGNENVPILRPTEQLQTTHTLVMESTYGDRVHEDATTREQTLRDAIIQTIHAQGVLLIPAFAIERTQQLLYEIHQMMEAHALPRIDTYLDSPMAIATSEIMKSFPEYYDAEALKEVSVGEDLFDFPGLHLTRTREESKTINNAPWPKIIISGSGMMNGGRILHHLVRYLGNPKCTVLIIGYQSASTLGHRLYRGDKEVMVLGERIHVRANIKSIGAYSAHGDQNKLVAWVKQAQTLPQHIYCTHGDEHASAALVTRLREELSLQADVPRLGETVDV